MGAPSPVAWQPDPVFEASVAGQPTGDGSFSSLRQGRFVLHDAVGQRSSERLLRQGPLTKNAKVLDLSGHLHTGRFANVLHIA